MFKIKIDTETQNYILQNGGIVTIDSFRTGRCWMSVAMPAVRFGEPESISNFDLYETEKISICISKILESDKDTIHIKFSSFFKIFKRLDAYGFKIL